MYKFAVPQVDIYQKGVERLGLSGLESILEVGCGSGRTLLGLREQGHQGKLAGLDINETLFQEVARMDRSIDFYTGSADALAFGDGSFDVVLSYFMVYHLPDIPKALTEWRRVLQDGGKLLVATFSSKNLPRSKVLKAKIGSYIGGVPNPQFSSIFNMENGLGQFEKSFRVVERYDYEGEVEIAQSEPYLDYLSSSCGFFRPAPEESLWGEGLQIVREEVDREIEEKGVFRDSVRRGLFVCVKEGI